MNAPENVAGVLVLDVEVGLGDVGAVELGVVTAVVGVELVVEVDVDDVLEELAVASTISRELVSGRIGTSTMPTE